MNPNHYRAWTRWGQIMRDIFVTVVTLAALLSALGEPSRAFAAGVGGTDSRVVRMAPGVFERHAADLGLPPDRVIDYGTFVWAQIPSANLDRLRAAGEPVEERPNAFTIRLGEQSFDPAINLPSLPVGWDAVSADGAGFHLVQLPGPTRGEWLAALEAEGLKIVKYVNANTYVVWGELGARLSIEANTTIARWAGPFVPAYRVLPRWRELDGSALKVDVLIYRGAGSDTTVRALEALGGVVRGRAVLSEAFEEVEMTLSGRVFQAAASVAGVYSIQPVPTDGGLRGEMSDQVNVNNVDPSNLAFPGYLSWLAGAGLDGNGVTIANVDGGVDQNHPDLVNRFLACSGTTCGGSAMDNHGTHTAGIMAADGSSGVTSLGFLRGLGQAPGANLVEQIYSPFYLEPGGMLLLMKDSYNNGASLSGNSWGPAGTPRGYDNDTMQVDIGVRDAEATLPGNQSLTYVLSFMNGGGGTSSQGTPDEAKNIFTIGSTKMQTSSGAQILQIDDVSANSAHGPALDGRTIPHMVAPGCSVDSTVPGGYAVSGFCGTSMASPHVSGAVALFIERYRGLPSYESDPSPALIKASFIAVARDLAGNRDADGGTLGHPFDSKQGWGRLDVEAVVDPQVAVLYFDNPAVLDDTGEEWTTSLSVADPAEPMRLMLAWTDAPGHGLGGSTPAWNNDLDLLVESGQDTYRGNNFGAAGWSMPGGSADLRNNTEGVFLGPAAPSVITVRVVAGNINSDGIPGEGDGTDQDFSLVCYNCLLQPDFVLNATPENVEVCAPTAAVYQVAVEQVFGFSDQVTLSSFGEPAGTNVSFSVNPVTPTGVSAMTISNTNSASPGTYSVTIEGTGPEFARADVVELKVSSALPGPPVLEFPADGAVGVSLLPEFTWSAASQASEYEIELSDDPDFNNILESASGITDLSYQAGTILTPFSVYYWRLRAFNACGVGSDSITFSFTSSESLPVLLVDDDDNAPDVRAFYTNALDALFVDYDIWDTNNSDNEPDAGTLGTYSSIVWFSGAEFGGASGPGAQGEAALTQYLDTGGCLFLSSQDYFWDRGLTTFMAGYLGVGSAVSDTLHTTVTGQGPIFQGMGPYSLSFPFDNYSDRISPDATATLAFSGDQGDAAIMKDAGGYRTLYWGFPFEVISDANARIELMATVLDWCGSAVLIDCNGNGIEDADDIASGFSKDCNGNGIPDLCDLTNDPSLDLNGNGVPDVCDPIIPPSLEQEHVRKNRYITVVPNEDVPTVAYQVEMSQGPGATGVVGWIGIPFDPSCQDGAGNPLPDNPPCTAVDRAARVVGDPVYRIWQVSPLHVGDCEIVPVATYLIRATADGITFSDALEIETIRKPGDQHHGDVVGFGTGDGFTAPQGVVNITDVQATLFNIQGFANAPHITWTDVTGLGIGAPPDFLINISDVQQILKGQRGETYLTSNLGENMDPVDCP